MGIEMTKQEDAKFFLTGKENFFLNNRLRLENTTFNDTLKIIVTNT
jgi:hypothetical protein